MLNEEALRVLESLDGWVEFSTIHNKYAFFCQIINLIWNIDFNWGFSKIFFLFFRQHFFFFIFVDVFLFDYQLCFEILLYISGKYQDHIGRGAAWSKDQKKKRGKQGEPVLSWSFVDDLQLKLICLDCYVQVNKLMDETERQLQAIAVLAENH